MLNQRVLRSGLPSPARSIAPKPLRDYAGTNIDRMSRFEARTARRYGDWGILEVPAALLWFDEVYDEIYEELGDPVLGPVIIDIW